MLRLIAFFAIALSALPAFAGDRAVCAERATVLKRLSKDFAEKPVAMGLASNGNVIEVFTSGASTTWTIVMTLPNGQSCLMAAGEGWEPIAAPDAEGPGA